jgi:hypothetical protein
MIYDRVFWGVMFWEFNLTKTFYEAIIPPNFFRAKLPYLSIYLPTAPEEDIS